jgi:ribosomal protein S18 acetylase RimI-like enzyme
VSRIEVVRTYLELADPSAFRPARSPDARARVERVAACPPSFARYLYAEVGRGYRWHDRLGWTDEEWRARLDDPAVELFLLSVAAAPAGYFELQAHGDGSAEIAYFGLLPEFVGRGLGKYLLTEAVTAGWQRGASRVWLHTCTLDDPAALPNYLARGFRAFRTETYEADVPAPA